MYGQKKVLSALMAWFCRAMLFQNRYCKYLRLPGKVHKLRRSEDFGRYRATSYALLPQRPS